MFTRRAEGTCAEESPIPAHQGHAAVTDGAEEHASSVSDGTTPWSVNGLFWLRRVNQTCIGRRRL
jgi:hypothetical protein